MRIPLHEAHLFQSKLPTRSEVGGPPVPTRGAHPFQRMGPTLQQRFRLPPGERNKRYLRRCCGCGKQYTVRIGTVMEDRRIPLAISHQFGAPPPSLPLQGGWQSPRQLRHCGSGGIHAKASH